MQSVAKPVAVCKLAKVPTRYFPVIAGSGSTQYFFCAPLLNITNGTGPPINPVAIK